MYGSSNYDLMGNFTGYVDPYEEELRRQEEERRRAEAAKPVTQRITYNADGTQDVTISGPATVLASTTGARARPQAVEPRMAAPVAPVSPEYAQYIQQQESGARPDIGYHYPAGPTGQRTSTAYGAYGITAPAYSDVQRLDPYFANRDITTLTPEEQQRALNVYTQQNQRALQQYGVTAGTGETALAHLLGARGAADFIQTGAISPQAAALNGGEANLRRLAEARLGYRPSPASAAAIPVTPGAPAAAPAAVRPEDLGEFAGVDEAIARQAAQAQAAPKATPEQVTAAMDQARRDQTAQSFVAAQNDPRSMLQFINDPNTPEDLRRQMERTYFDTMKQKYEAARVQQDFSQAVQSGDTKKAAGMLQAKGEEGSLLRAWLYAAIGFKSGAEAEVAKMNLPAKWAPAMTQAGDTGLVQYSTSGMPLRGVKSDGTEMTSDELVAYASQAGVGKYKADVGEIVEKNGMVGRVVTQAMPNGTTKTYVESGGRQFPLDATWIPRKISTSAAMKEQGYFIDLKRRYGTNVLDAYNQFVKDSPTPPTAAEQQMFFQQYNALPIAQAAGVVGAAPAAAPAAPAAVAPSAVAPAATPTAPVTPVEPAAVAAPAAAPAAPAAPVAPAAGVDATGKPVRMMGEGDTVFRARYKAWEDQQKSQREVTETEQKAFVAKEGPKEQIGIAAADGQTISNARRQQLDLIRSNPSIVNIMNGAGTQYDKARNVILRAATGAYGSDEREQLYRDVRATGMSESEQAALQEFVNLNTVINAKTLRANAGPGAVSNAEQTANKEANIGNIDRIPVYAALAGLHRSQFSGDLAASKQAFLDANPNIKTTAQFNTAWQREESKLLRQYQAITRARFDVMGRPPQADAGADAIAAYRDRVFRAFEAYPAPTFDPATGRWDYRTANARRAAMAAVLGQ